ncbi:MAG TPA: UDP-N-acetylmuramate dehydrogenase [Patescibacteria group bacterium]|nr:UDP-N-acetylmuramate dehydrogenase [Patescibacteria group bacterium]
MYVLENVPLSGYSTMRLGGTAAYLTEISAKTEIPEALSWAESRNLPIIMIGIGSNIVWRDEGFPGLILVNKISQFDSFEEDATNTYFTIGAGENWDATVARTVELGFSGIEQLSLIPGTTGATPVQNVGAYGREISDVLTTVEAYDRNLKKMVVIPTSDCEFGYRTSRFKTTDKNRFFITSITLHLTKSNPMPPFYPSLQSYLTEKNIHEYTPATIRNAVVAIRQAKLPNPEVIPNNGSFFANPVISQDNFDILRADYPDIQYWQTATPQQVKLPAAWLIEKAGFANIKDAETGMSTWANQPLVLVNDHATHTADLLKFKQKIVDAVKSKFNIELAQEPELLP